MISMDRIEKIFINVIAEAMLDVHSSDKSLGSFEWKFVVHIEYALINSFLCKFCGF